MKRGSGWGVVAQNVKTRCQNLNWNPTQTTGVVQLIPNFVGHIVMLSKHDLRQKNLISGQLLSYPLWYYTHLWELLP
jgi:hypothetical protein